MFRLLSFLLGVGWGTLLIGSSLAGDSANKANKADKANPFTVAPRDAFAILADLNKVSGQKQTNSPEETRLFAHVAGSKPRMFSFAEAALIASGVTDATKRQEYVKRLDSIEAQARKALAGAETERQRGDKLLRFLHAGPMAGGYEASQTTLAGILDNRKYNCVSSAVLYNVIGKKFDLNLKAIDIPASAFFSGHVFSILRTEGVVIEIETTNKDGFNIEGKRERPDGVSYDPKTSGNRHEVDDLGLAALVYYNRGVKLSKKEKYHAAIVMNFRALCLDAGNKGAAKNALADLGNWGPKLAKEGKYEDGLLVLAIGLKLAPNDSVLKNNQRTLWIEYAHATMKKGKDEEALAIASRAAAILKDDASQRLPADLYLVPAEELARNSKWQSGLALVERGLSKVTGTPAKKLSAWRADLFLHWSNECQRKKDWDGAFAVLEKARADNPKDTRYANNIAFLVQERLIETAQSEPAKLNERAQELRKRYSTLERVGQVIFKVVQQEVQKKTDAMKFADALAALKERTPMLADAREAQKLGVLIYDGWARSKQKDGWKSVVQIYADGLKMYAGDSLLTQNAVATIDAQGVPLLNAQKYAEALEIYETGLKYLPGNQRLEDRRKTIQGRMSKK
jgi:tetratricopeptide (TPR) repeat protein